MRRTSPCTRIIGGRPADRCRSEALFLTEKASSSAMSIEGRSGRIAPRKVESIMSPIAANLQAVRRRISEALQGDSREVRVGRGLQDAASADAIREAFAGRLPRFRRKLRAGSAAQDRRRWRAVPRTLALHRPAAEQQGARRGRALRLVPRRLDRAKIARGPLAASPDGPGAPQRVHPGEHQRRGDQERRRGRTRRCRSRARSRRCRASQLRGVMGMASPTADVGAAAARVRVAAARVRGSCARPGFALDTLSMGMTQDLEAALAEGATMVRIGTAIFGSAREGGA